MRLRDDLLAQSGDIVLSSSAQAQAAGAELLADACAHLADDPGYILERDAILRPDGVSVPLRDADPFATLGRLTQSDLLVLAGDDDVYRLLGGVLCFPASWSLKGATGQGLSDIHAPVPFFAGGLNRRVGRIFQALRADAPLWRANWLIHQSPDLHLPTRREKTTADWSQGDIFLRIERQTLRRLRKSHTVVFGIHTSITPLDLLSNSDLDAMIEAIDGLSEAELAYKGGQGVRAGVARFQTT